MRINTIKNCLSDRRVRTSLIAIVADVLLTAIKTSLALITNSTALMADAFHSATDLFVSVVLLISLIVRYNIEKQNLPVSIERAHRLESLMAILVSLLILYVPFELIVSIETKNSEKISHLWIGILGTLLTIIIIFFIAHFKSFIGKATNSPALEADGYHSWIDLFSSVAVLCTLVGMMVGIYLDEIIAIVIALMIAIAGLELFVSGIRSLVKGSELEQLSLFGLLLFVCSCIPFSNNFIKSVQYSSTSVYQYRRLLLPAFIFIYLASGFRQVPYGYIGLQHRFNKILHNDLAAGLHYALPWPIEKIQLVEHAKVLSTTSNHKKEFDTGLWHEIKASRWQKDNTHYLVTGDENLIDLSFTIQYRINNPAQLYLDTHDLQGIIFSYLESAVWQQSATNTFNSILSNAYYSFTQKISEQVQSDLYAIGIEISIVDVHVQSIQPPAMVVSVYRDVLNADQEQQQRKNRAIAQRLNDLPIANAQRITQRANIDAQAMERHYTAQGDSERNLFLANVYEQHPRAVRFHLYIESLMTNLSGKSLLIRDPSTSNQYFPFSSALPHPLFDSSTRD